MREAREELDMTSPVMIEMKLTEGYLCRKSFVEEWWGNQAAQCLNGSKINIKYRFNKRIWVSINRPKEKWPKHSGTAITAQRAPVHMFFSVSHNSEEQNTCYEQVCVSVLVILFIISLSYIFSYKFPEGSWYVNSAFLGLLSSLPAAKKNWESAQAIKHCSCVCFIPHQVQFPVLIHSRP